MKSFRKHLFHLVYPNICPLFTGIGMFFFTSSLVFCMHRLPFSFYFFWFSIFFLLLCCFFWLRDIILEGTFFGDHTLVVRSGLKNGFLLFIVSEAMLFFGFFWAFFHSALSPTIFIGAEWPPVFIDVISTYDYPLFNTGLLIVSGFSVTWAHRGVSIGSFRESIDSLFITIMLGFFFVLLQILEYYESNFSLIDGIYSSTFYMLTGLHGCHVIAGTLFLLVCFFRLLCNHYLTNHYLGFVFAIWYWHFVDVVWILLFLSVYCWGSW